MALQIILYLISFLLVFAFNVINASYVPFLVDVVFASMSVISLGIAIWLRNSVNVFFESESNTAERGYDYNLNIKITNKAGIPLTRCRIYLVIETTKNKRHKRKVNMMCPAKSSETMSISVKCPYCEVIKVHIKKIGVFDYLNIFRLPKKNDALAQIIVMPHLLDTDIVSRLTNAISDGEDTVYSDKKAGDDPTEIFAIREYAGGDKIRNIHWKLSSKVNELMVKDHGLPLQENDTIVLDSFSQNNDIGRREAIYDILLGLIYALTNRGFGFNICYITTEYVFRRIETQNDIFELFADIYSIIPYDEEITSCAQIYHSMYNGMKNRIFYVTEKYSDKAVLNMELLYETGPVYYLIPEMIQNGMPVKFHK